MDNLNAYLERLTKAVEEGTKNATVKSAFLLEREMKKEAPVDTSNLKNSIYTRVDRPNYLAQVLSPMFYTRYVIEGTGIYNTASTNTTGWFYTVSNPSSKYLGTHFTMGQKPNDFPDRGFDNAKPAITKLVQKEINNAISKL